MPSIALVCISMNELGGKNKHLRTLYRELNNNGIKTYLICCSKIQDRLRKYMYEGGAKEEDLFFVSRLGKWMILPLIFQLAFLFRKLHIDTVHTFQLESDAFGAVAANIARIKRLYSTTESKVIPENISLPKRVFYRTVNLFIKKQFIQTVAVSSALEREIIEEGFRPAGCTKTVPIGIEIPEKYKNFKRLPKHFEKRQFIIGTIARFSFEKALDRIIKAAPFVLKEIPFARFVLVGEGPEEQSLKRTVHMLHLEDRIIFKSWTNDPWVEIASFDVFVLSSVREGCPHTLLEALFMQCPVVASDIAGVRAIIQSDFNGLLADSSNPRVFADKIIRFLLDPNFALKMAENGRKTVEDQYLIDCEIRRMLEIYKITESVAARAID